MSSRSTTPTSMPWSPGCGNSLRAGRTRCSTTSAGHALRRSWSLLAPGGTLVSYALAAAAQGTGALVPQFVALLARLAAWNILPNGRRASFYDVWSGRRLRPARFRARLHQDLSAVLALLADGALTAEVAACFPLTEVSAAMRLAESHTVRGKVILIP